MATIISITANLALLLAKKGKRVTLAEVVIVDIGAGTSYHALDFFLMADDHHVTVATPDPTLELGLYRFIKLAAIRRVLSSFLARGAMADALSDRDFSSVEEVLDVVGQTDETSRGIAETALRTFHPTLILNRLSGRAHVEPHGFSLLRRSSFGCEGRTAVVPFVSSAEPAESTPPK
ncbi:MAG: hypothetical protein CAF41_004900 [Nitrospira sp. CG24A]|nr:MAG: hypothetical protein CAF41_004900 [Nitrospira sp. CG24A]